MRPLRTVEKQWLFDPAMLERTPSRSDGISYERELEMRREAILFMRSLWLRVSGITGDKDPETTNGKGPMTAGTTLLHRFFMRRSLNDFEPQLVAPVMLFLASKVEESPLRLRHIVNACLAKFEPSARLWEPEAGGGGQQPLEYKRWEKDILATEEVALEALCFDMVVEQPWPILRHGVQGLNQLWTEPESESSAAAEARAAAVNGSTNGNGNAKGKSRATEEIVTELGWAMLNEGLLAPLAILHPAPVLALATFALILALLDEQPLPVALAAAAELGDRFGLDVEFDETEGAKGEDMAAVKEATQQYIEYCQMGIITKNLCPYLEEHTETPESYHRRFKTSSQSNGDKANGRPINGVKEV